MQVGSILAGIILLFLGRKLFWLFVGFVGFLVGMRIAAEVLAGHPAWVFVLAGLVLGIIGAAVAIVLERLAFAVAGFFTCVFLAMTFSQEFGEPYNIAVLFLAGALGAIFAFLIMDWAIIFLSSILGAGLIVSVLKLGPTWGTLVYLILVFTGFVVQSQLMEQSNKPADVR